MSEDLQPQRGQQLNSPLRAEKFVSSTAFPLSCPSHVNVAACVLTVSSSSSLMASLQTTASGWSSSSVKKAVKRSTATVVSIVEVITAGSMVGNVKRLKSVGQGIS